MAQFACYRVGVSADSWNHRYTEFLGGGWSLNVSLQGQRAAPCWSSAPSPGVPDFQLQVLSTITMLSLGYTFKDAGNAFYPKPTPNSSQPAE